MAKSETINEDHPTLKAAIKMFGDNIIKQIRGKKSLKN